MVPPLVGYAILNICRTHRGKIITFSLDVLRLESYKEEKHFKSLIENKSVARRAKTTSFVFAPATFILVIHVQNGLLCLVTI
jgi:hypothetical protein